MIAQAFLLHLVTVIIQTVASVWPTNGNVETVVGSVERSANGLTTWATSYGRTARSDVKFTGNGARYVTNTAPDGTRSLGYFLKGFLQSVTVNDTNGTQLAQTTLSYDGSPAARA